MDIQRPFAVGLQYLATTSEHVFNDGPVQGCPNYDVT